MMLFCPGATMCRVQQMAPLILSLAMSGCAAAGLIAPGSTNSYVATLALAPVAPPPPAPVDYQRQSLQLNWGMSEQNVIDVLGQPQQSALTTCGYRVGKQWQCKIWKYGVFGDLAVFFRKDNSTGAWLVNRWEQ
jgi:hypothetical protein